MDVNWRLEQETASCRTDVGEKPHSFIGHELEGQPYSRQCSLAYQEVRESAVARTLMHVHINENLQTKTSEIRHASIHP